MTRRARAMTSLCPNCDMRFVQRHPRDVYCGYPCASQADVVRYLRSVEARYGDDQPEDVQWAVQIQIAWMLSGGYPRSERRIPTEVREAVKERDGGLCVQCGEPGVDLDHIDGNESTAENLRLLCRPCHEAITRTRLAPLEPDDDERQRRLMETLLRAATEPPMKPCDAPDWASRWQGWIREHRQEA